MSEQMSEPNVQIAAGIPSVRPDGRRPDQLRRIRFQNHIAPYATGSTLVEWGQTRVICGARAFVGTYGGFSYLAPFYGVDTVAFYSHATGFRFDHLELAKRVFSSLRCGSFVALDLKDIDVVRLGLGRNEFVQAVEMGSRP